LAIPAGGNFRRHNCSPEWLGWRHYHGSPVPHYFKEIDAQRYGIVAFHSSNPVDFRFDKIYQHYPRPTNF
jgi:hypothetical protein